MSTWNSAGEVELVNRQVLEYFGKTTEEMKDWTTGDAVHPDDLPQMIDAFKRAIETGLPLDVETRSRRADGVYHWFQVRVRPERDADGRIVRWYNLSTDIDERKRAEVGLAKAFDEIAKSEAELRTIIDVIPQLIVALGADGKFLNANQAVLDYTGLGTKEEVSSQNFGDTFHPEDTARLHDQREAAISRGAIRVRTPSTAGWSVSLVPDPIQPAAGRTRQCHPLVCDRYRAEHRRSQTGGGANTAGEPRVTRANRSGLHV